ncbi:hypothetical protein MKW92_035705 [Papaver armeniacum]|nr:hypothetical protein MKW92_035705 [Papaver armeniacum]
MGRNRKACAACKYHRKRCSPECPLAPYFPSDTGGEDFQNVVKVFGASNFTKLIKSAHPHQCLAAKTMIIEARARKYDHVHGLAGIVETLLQQLNNLTTKLAFMNQQNQFHRRHSVSLQQEQPHFRSNEAKELLHHH